MRPILAAAMEGPDTWNGLGAVFIISALILAVGVLNILVQIKQLRRTPSIETEITQLKAAADQAKKVLEPLPALAARLDAMEQSIGGIHRRLAFGDDTMTKLQVNQGINAEAIQTIKHEVREMSVQVFNIAGKVCRPRSARGSE